MNSRDFLKGTTCGLAGLASARWAEALAHPAAGQSWGGWKSGEFQVHFIYTGLGEQQFLIFPDGTGLYPWTAKAAKPTWEAAHNVLTVAPGGDAYTMTCLAAKDESMQTKAVFDFKS